MLPSTLSAALWVYQPTLTAHDPDPPLPLEDPPPTPGGSTLVVLDKAQFRRIFSFIFGRVN